MYYQFQDMFANRLIIWLIPIVLLLIIGFSLYMIRKNKKRITQLIFWMKDLLIME
jgi:cytochrome c-type biogenesis protein CcmH/NrfF